MKKFLLSISIMLAVGGCVYSEPQDVVTTAPPSETPPIAAPYCREYTQKIIIAGKTQTTYGTACQQPDGSWAVQQPASSSLIAPQTSNQPIIITPQPAYPYPAPVTTSIGVGIGVGGGRHW